MKTLVIIRTCKRDDFISYLCYKSFVIHLDCDVIFFAEEGEYKWIPKANQQIIYRPFCDNFGGKSNVITYLEQLKKINTEEYDKVILSDADIILDRNPFENEFDFGGIEDVNNPLHYSGQLLIFSRWLFDKVLHYEKYNEVFELIDANGYSIADDTVLSFVATAYSENVFDFNGKGFWRHDKYHHVEKMWPNNE